MPNGDNCVNYPSNLFRNSHSFEPRNARENICWIINSDTLDFKMRQHILTTYKYHKCLIITRALIPNKRRTVKFNRECTPCGPVFSYLRSHTKHLNGFSPEWIRRWAVRLASWENDFIQMWHWYGFSPEWVRMCVRKVEGRAYTLSQRRHLFALVPGSLGLSFWDWIVSSWNMGPE